MKLFTILSLLLIGTSGFAETYTAHKNIKSANVTLTSLCPAGETNCLVDGTRITLDYTVDCTEKFVSQSYEAVQVGEQQTYVFVSTVLSYTADTEPDPNQITCKGFSSETKNIDLINVFGTVQIIFLTNTSK